MARRLIPGSNELMVEADGSVTNKGNHLGCGLGIGNGLFLTAGDIVDGQYLKRSGTTIISGSPSGGSSLTETHIPMILLAQALTI